MHLKTVRGHTIEEQIQSIDNILSAGARRGERQKACVVPSLIPISMCASQVTPNQVLTKFLFPVSGRISSVASHLYGAKHLMVDIELNSLKGKMSEILSIPEGKKIEQAADIKIEAGSLLTVTAVDVDRPSDPSWIGLEIALALTFIADLTQADLTRVKVGQ